MITQWRITARVELYRYAVWPEPDSPNQPDNVDNVDHRFLSQTTEDPLAVHHFTSSIDLQLSVGSFD